MLGFLISARAIEGNPGKIAAIDNMQQPRNVRDIQKFAGCLASLSRFIGRLGEKALPLYPLLKRVEYIVWSEVADSTFLNLKRALTNTPVLAPPSPKEPMLLYIAATNRVISVVLVVEGEGAGK